MLEPIPDKRFQDISEVKEQLSQLNMQSVPETNIMKTQVLRPRASHQQASQVNQQVIGRMTVPSHSHAYTTQATQKQSRTNYLFIGC